MVSPKDDSDGSADGIQGSEAGDTFLGGGTADLETIPERDTTSGNGIDHTVYRTVIDDVNNIGVSLTQSFTDGCYREPGSFKHGGCAFGGIQSIAGRGEIPDDG